MINLHIYIVKVDWYSEILEFRIPKNERYRSRSNTSNDFDGELPSTLPTSLEEIRVDRNDIKGILPIDTIRIMKYLREFHAGRNRLDGEKSEMSFPVRNLSVGSWCRSTRRRFFGK